MIGLIHAPPKHRDKYADDSLSKELAEYRRVRQVCPSANDRAHFDAIPQMYELTDG